jgi:hypothetical protein
MLAYNYAKSNVEHKTSSPLWDVWANEVITDVYAMEEESDNELDEQESTIKEETS